MRFTLVVPTIGRSDCLHELFTSFINQSFKNFEVVVIDQNKDNRVIEVVQKYTESLDIRHIRHPPNGASAARNAGIEVARGKIVTFPDDDCEYPADLLQQMDRLFDQHAMYCGITVNTTTRSGKRGMARLSSSPGEINKMNILSRLVEFTIFLRTDKIGHTRFDENFGPGSSTGYWCDEGPDLILRMIKGGCKFLYTPDPVVYHPNPTIVVDEKVVKRSYQYGLARGKYLYRHHYPFWFVLFVWSKYMVGVLISLVVLRFPKAKYYLMGLKGRIQGYISNQEI